MKKFLSLALIVFSILGIFDASYLTYEKINGYVPPCTAHFQCGQVLNSLWATIGPVPISILGFIFYATFLGLSIWLFLEKRYLPFLGIKLDTEKLLVLLGVVGVSFSVYFVFLMGVVIKAWCFYCLLSALTSSILFLLSSSMYFLTRKEKKHEMHI